MFDSCAKKDIVKDSWTASTRLADTVSASNNGSVGRKCKTKSEPQKAVQKNLFRVISLVFLLLSGGNE
jgi:hypothetical protein